MASCSVSMARLTRRYLTSSSASMIAPSTSIPCGLGSGIVTLSLLGSGECSTNAMAIEMTDARGSGPRVHLLSACDLETLLRVPDLDARRFDRHVEIALTLAAVRD